MEDFLPPGRWKFPELKRELLTVGAYGIALVQRCLGPIQRVYAQAGSHFFAEHRARGADDFGTITMTDDQGRLATLCGGRIGVAAHPLGGPSQAYLVGGKQSARIEAKRPAVDAFLRQRIIDADYQPSPQDPMQWASGPPGLAASARDDVAGLARGLDDLVEALDQDRSPAYTVADDRQLLEIAFAAYRSVVEGAPIDLPLAREAQ